MAGIAARNGVGILMNVKRSKRYKTIEPSTQITISIPGKKYESFYLSMNFLDGLTFEQSANEIGKIILNKLLNE